MVYKGGAFMEQSYVAFGGGSASMLSMILMILVWFIIIGVPIIIIVRIIKRNDKK